MSSWNIRDKVVLVTGANSGLGKATALSLAQLGAIVVIVARSKERGEGARQEIVAASGNPNVDLLVADLASQQSIRTLNTQFRAKYDNLHILINNAGISLTTRTLTEDGIEKVFAVNHLASFLLTNLLLDVLVASAPARIINVATRVNTAIDFDDLQYEKRPYRSFAVYAHAKLGNIHFTYELARKLQGTNVTVNCVHPGVFQSNLGKADGPESPVWRVAGALARYILPTAAIAAKRIVYLATDPHLATVSGKYFGDREELKSPLQTYDQHANARLWQVSAELTNL
jgi:retinol dehydrogenase 13